MRNKTIHILIYLTVAFPCLIYGQQSPLEEAQSYLRNGQLNQAIDSLKQSISKYPNDLDLHCAMGQAYARNKNYELSEEKYLFVLSKHPVYYDALMGLARLRGYQGKHGESLEYIKQGRSIYPEDETFKSEEVRMSKILNYEKCTNKERFILRAGYEHENYSFADNGYNWSLSLRDRKIFGWDTTAAFNRAHRFNQDDSEYFVSTAKTIAPINGFIYFHGAAASEHTLFAKYRTMTGVGFHLTNWLISELYYGFKVYDTLKLDELRPRIYLDWKNFQLRYDYLWVKTTFNNIGSDDGLSSQLFQLSYFKFCTLKPWISYSHTKEAFEVGRSGVPQAFRADHYSIGASYKLSKKAGLNLHYSREERPDRNEHITRTGLNGFYSWGN